MSEMTREQLHDVLHKYMANGTPITVFFDIGETFDALQSQLAALRQERDTAQARLEQFEKGYQGACYACEPVGLLNKKLSQQLASLRLRWTSERPTQPGWYWWRINPDDAEPVLVSARHKGLGFYTIANPEWEQNFTGEWAGPIPLPQGREA